MKKKVRLKKTVKRKFLLFVILAVIMTGLIVGELTIGQREVKDPAVERLEAKNQRNNHTGRTAGGDDRRRDYRGNDSP